jgi:hypothetical protein
MNTLNVVLLAIALLNLLFISGLDARNAYTDLYNSRVSRAERWERPMVKWWQKWPRHCGVVVTLRNGDRWLVHKGDHYGNPSQTVVTSTSNMLGNWQLKGSKSVYRSTVGDYVRAGGAYYNLITANCLHACDDMMALP